MGSVKKTSGNFGCSPSGEIKDHSNATILPAAEKSPTRMLHFSNTTLFLSAATVTIENALPLSSLDAVLGGLRQLDLEVSYGSAGYVLRRSVWFDSQVRQIAKNGSAGSRNRTEITEIKLVSDDPPVANPFKDMRISVLCLKKSIEQQPFLVK